MINGLFQNGLAEDKYRFDGFEETFLVKNKHIQNDNIHIKLDFLGPRRHH